MFPSPLIARRNAASNPTRADATLESATLAVGAVPWAVGPAEVAEPEVLPAPVGVEDEGDADLDRPWNVVLLDDDSHTYDYVVEMLCDLFGYPVRKAFRMAVEVDTAKRVVVWTGHREIAEAKQEAIHEYGPDRRMGEESLGSMTAVLERAR